RTDTCACTRAGAKRIRDSYGPSDHPRLLFFLNDPPTTEISTLSLHDALPIFVIMGVGGRQFVCVCVCVCVCVPMCVCVCLSHIICATRVFLSTHLSCQF